MRSSLSYFRLVFLTRFSGVAASSGVGDVELVVVFAGGLVVFVGGLVVFAGGSVASSVAVDVTNLSPLPLANFFMIPLLTDVGVIVVVFVVVVVVGL